MIKMPRNTRRCKLCKDSGHYSTKCPNVVVNDTTVIQQKFEEKIVETKVEDEVEVEVSPWIEIPVEEEVLNKFKIIVEMCKEVADTLKKGFGEIVYEAAICVELQQRHIEYSQQETIPICYKGHYIGNNRLDIIIHHWLPIILETKATSSITTEDRWQVIRYMSRKNVPYGVVINFSQTIKGKLYFSFIVKHNDVYYQYSLEENKAKPMIDY